MLVRKIISIHLGQSGNYAVYRSNIVFELFDCKYNLKQFELLQNTASTSTTIGGMRRVENTSTTPNKFSDCLDCSSNKYLRQIEASTTTARKEFNLNLFWNHIYGKADES